MREKIFREVLSAVRNDQAPVVRFRKPVWLAAASLVIALGVGYFLLPVKKQLPQHVATEKSQPPVRKDILPGRQVAILTTGDGSRIDLDSSRGVVSRMDGINVINLNGVVTYKKASGIAHENNIFNTLSTARGNQYQVQLSDGSKVWLNAVSSVRFPISFTNSTVREVQLTGEGYFEVMKDAKKPFRVNINGVMVEVLGTHFNINAYADESGIATTLLEGRVRIGDVTLKPGQQALGKDGKIAIRNNVDVQRVMAWQRGIFEFNQTDLVTIMRQVSRWYDVDVRYASVPPNVKFGGSINKHLPLANVLRLLEENGVRSKLENRILTVQ